MQAQVKKSPNGVAVNIEMRRMLEQQSIRRKFFMFDKSKRETQTSFYQSNKPIRQ